MQWWHCRQINDWNFSQERYGAVLQYRTTSTSQKARLLYNLLQRAYRCFSCDQFIKRSNNAQKKFIMISQTICINREKRCLTNYTPLVFCILMIKVSLKTDKNWLRFSLCAKQQFARFRYFNGTHVLPSVSVSSNLTWRNKLSMEFQPKALAESAFYAPDGLATEQSTNKRKFLGKWN